ncbi:ferredoxin [Streptomyces ardesiacus]
MPPGRPSAPRRSGGSRLPAIEYECHYGLESGCVERAVVPVTEGGLMSGAGESAGIGIIGAERDRCVGAGQCVLAAPTVFDQDEADGRVLVLDEQPPASRAAAVREAVWACPSGALRLR